MSDLLTIKFCRMFSIPDNCVSATLHLSPYDVPRLEVVTALFRQPLGSKEFEYLHEEFDLVPRKDARPAR